MERGAQWALHVKRGTGNTFGSVSWEVNGENETGLVEGRNV